MKYSYHLITKLSYCLFNTDVRNLFLLLLIICFTDAFASDAGASGAIALPSQTATIIISKKNVVRELRGMVLDVDAAPVSGVNIDVLDHPEWMMKGRSGNLVAQHFIATTNSDSKGEFQFPKLPVGKYDVRFTMIGLNPVHLYVEVKSRHWRKRKIIVVMSRTILPTPQPAIGMQRGAN